MPDIFIVRSLYRAVLIAQTEKGERWIAENMHKGKASFTVNVEYIDDLIKDIKEDGIEVDWK